MSGEKLFETQAELCRAMGSALRLEIMHLLRDKPMSVSDIASATVQPQGTISRNLGILRNAGVVVTQRTGNLVLYQVADIKLLQACDLMRKVLEEKIAHAVRVMDQF
jgi:ArsR family transcriptional regulator, virulence genes transcriptional regulator